MTRPATVTTAPADGEVIDALEAALATTGTLVAGIAVTQWSAPTPCPGWDVRTLTNHLVGGLRIVAAELTGTDAGREHEEDWLGASPAAAAGTAVLAAWRTPGMMTRTLSISLGDVPAPRGAAIELTEVVVYGLDVAVATGQEDRVDAGQATALHELMLGQRLTAAGDVPLHRRVRC